MGNAPIMGRGYHDSQDGIYKKMVKEMLDTDDKGFTDKEIEFLENVQKFSHTSPKQRAWIEKLYQEKM